MGDTDIYLWLNSHKHDALAEALAAEGKEVTAEAQALLERLYEQTVPADLRREIEDRITREDRAHEAELEEQRRRNRKISAIQVTENGVSCCFTSDIYLTHQIIARRCSVALRDKEAIRSGSLAESAFLVREPAEQKSFELLCQNHNEKVTAIAAVDFDEGSFSVLQHGRWTAIPSRR